VAVSSDLQDWLIEKIGIPASRVVCIPNGIDITTFATVNGANGTRPLLGSFAPPGTVLIGTVGRLDAVKDHAGLISAFCKLCDTLPGERQRLRLVLVGEGPQRSVLESQIAGTGLPAQIRLLGNRTDVAALLAEFDIFVLSSIAEGMPGAVLEAMATGLPAVATAVGGVGEVVKTGVTGTLVAASDPEALAEVLAIYVADETLRMQHGKAGRERVVAQFSLQTMLAAYTKLYDGLLKRIHQQHQQVVAAPPATEHKER
jgi:glycosyltransferase involved in cell wall biosynthesis